MDEPVNAQASPPRWIAVHSAPVWDVLALKERLEARGIPTQLPEWIASLFEMGVDPDDVSAMVCVPADHASAAREVLAEHRAELETTSTLLATGPDRGREERRVEAIGVRMRYAALSVMFAPWALAHAAEYYRSTRALGWRPKEHAWNVAALGVGVAMAIFAASAIAVSMAY